MRYFLVQTSAASLSKVWQKLEVEFGMKPVLCVDPGIGPEKMGRQFPGIVCLDWHDLIVNRVPPKWEHCTHGPFDRYCREVWIRDAQFILDQYQRWDLSGDFGWLERTQHFYKQLVLWNTLITELKPDLMVFMWPPHVQHDAVLLALARARGIRHVVLNYTWNTKRWMAQPSMDFGLFRQRDLRFTRWELEAGLHLTQKDLPPPSRKRLEEVSGTDAKAAVPAYSKHLWNKSPQRGGWFKNACAALGTISRAVTQDIRNLAKGRHHEPLRLAGKFKERGKPFEHSFTGAFSLTRFALGRLRDRRKLAQAKASSEFWSKPAGEDKKPYIYAPLHFQPEMSTNPLGGEFSAQFLMLNLLAHSLPEGWELWVKDHPAQFLDDDKYPFLLHHIARNDNYYRTIAELPNTRLLSSNLTPFDLIDGSQAVAAITGTAGWEAIVRGKPALVFGEVWFDGAPNAFRVKTMEDVRQAIAKIAESGHAGQVDLVPFLKEMELHTFDLADQFEKPFPDLRLARATEQMARSIAHAAGCFGPEKLVLAEILDDGLNPQIIRPAMSPMPPSPQEDAAPQTAPAAVIDWSADLANLPQDVTFDQLPPLVRELVLRNKLLRERIARLEQQLWEANPDENLEPPPAVRKLQDQAQRVFELEHRVEELGDVAAQLEAAKSKIEDLRSMKTRREERIKKLEKKLGISGKNPEAPEK